MIFNGMGNGYDEWPLILLFYRCCFGGCVCVA